MDDIQKTRISELRTEGYSCKRIAQELGLSENTVKSFCRRNKTMDGTVEKPKATAEHVCLQCGVPVMQTEGRKEKKFCSDRCRNKWWNSHLSEVKRKAMYEYTCPNCKKTFMAYGNRNRKYCSHECYINDRFGGDGND